MKTWRNLQILTNEEIINFLEKTMECEAPEKVEVLRYKLIMEQEKLVKKKSNFEAVCMTREEKQKASSAIGRTIKKIDKLERKMELENDN